MVRAHQTIRVELVAVWVPAVAVAEAVVASLVAVAEVEEEGKYIYHLTIYHLPFTIYN